MPLLKFDLIEGRSDEEIHTLLNAAHEAMVQAFQVPYSDRYQVVNQHRPAEMMLHDTGLGYTRSEKVVMLTVLSRPRKREQKTRFYHLLAEKLYTTCDLSPDDLIVSMVENADADWSFGRGKAQFLTGEL